MPTAIIAVFKQVFDVNLSCIPSFVYAAEETVFREMLYPVNLFRSVIDDISKANQF